MIDFNDLAEVCLRPEPWSFYTTERLWDDPYISAQMLKAHLEPGNDAASRNHAFVDRSIAWIVERFGLAEGKKVIDFGCGPGLYTSGFARAGSRVTGIDFSRNSIRYAREKAESAQLNINYTCGNYLNYEAAEQYDLATLIFCDFCALSPTQRRKLLENIRGSLTSGGHLLLDVHSMPSLDGWHEGTGIQHYPQGGFWSASEYYEIVNRFKYCAQKVTLAKYAIIETERAWTIYNWLQYFTLAELTEELAHSGFKVIEQYSDVAGSAYNEDAPEIAVVAVKD